MSISSVFKPSAMLSSDETYLISSLLKSRCTCLVSTVVELYISIEDTRTYGWMKEDVGVLSFEKDSAKRSYFFRLYCPNRKLLVWEHELYNYINYVKLTPYLHSFEAEEYVVGFNFANEDDAGVLYDMVQLKVWKKVLRSEKSNNGNPGFTSYIPKEEQPVKIQFTKQEKKRKRKLRKDMIGQPTNFQHLTHFSYNTKESNFNHIDEDNLNKFFDKAGVSEEDRNDPGTRKFIDKFIRDNGGMEAVKHELKPPEQLFQLPPPNNSNPASSGLIPPPPPLRLSHVSSDSSIIPPPPPTLPPPLLPSPNPQEVDAHGQLLESIRKGTVLKHTSRSCTDGRDQTHKGAEANRSNLLDEIKQGVPLHSIPKVEENKRVNQSQGGLANALSQALAARSVFLQQSDSDSSRASSEESWDDD